MLFARVLLSCCQQLLSLNIIPGILLLASLRRDRNAITLAGLQWEYIFPTAVEIESGGEGTFWAASVLWDPTQRSKRELSHWSVFVLFPAFSRPRWTISSSVPRSLSCSMWLPWAMRMRPLRQALPCRWTQWSSPVRVHWPTSTRWAWTGRGSCVPSQPSVMAAVQGAGADGPWGLSHTWLNTWCRGIDRHSS